MKVNEIITELFDKPVKWSTDSYGDSRFWVGGIEYYIEFTQIGGDTINIVFSDASNEGDIGISGALGPKAITVFSTVITLILKMINERRPGNFKFSADLSEPSRVKLYDRLAKMLSNKIPYSLEVKDEYRERNYLFSRQK